MKIPSFLIIGIALAGCSTAADSIDRMRYGEKSTTQIPTDEFIAVGNFKNKIGALELANRQATKFCKHWRASPSIISQETKINSGENDNIGKGIVRSLKQTLTNEGSTNDYVETTIKYKCY